MTEQTYTDFEITVIERPLATGFKYEWTLYGKTLHGKRQLVQSYGNTKRGCRRAARRKMKKINGKDVRQKLVLEESWSTT